MTKGMMKFIIALLLLFLGVILIAVYILLSGKSVPLSDKEKQAVLAKLLGREPVMTEQVKNPGWTEYEGKYLDLSYPIAASLYKPGMELNMSSTKGLLDDFEFEEIQPHYMFVIQIIQQTSGIQGYDDIPGVKLREIDSTYIKRNLEIGGYSALEFEKNDEQIEKSAFLLVSGKIYTFAVSGTNPKIEEIFDRVIGSVKIKN